MGHIKMMGAVQPFISGAISKTVNVPKAATVEEIEQAYIDAWRIGAKAVSIYRDGSKRTQPLNTSKDKEKVTAADAAAAAPEAPRRHKLPDERRSITHKFDIGGHEGYITVGLYEDGQPGELFLTMAKEGSTISGLMDSFATAISLTLQYGVPLEALVEKFSHMRFEPAGYTKNPEIPIAKSLVDYIFRWLASKFLTADLKEKVGIISREEPGPATSASGYRGATALTPVTDAAAAPIAAAFQAIASIASGAPAEVSEARPIGFAVPAVSVSRGAFAFENSADAPSCHECGSLMVRGGACYKCLNCGATSGCS
jgi:ribonucleoside-diphosphate reductase alpha chain